MPDRINLPAGLEDKAVEIYTYNGEIKAIYNGKISKFIELPADVLAQFYTAMFNDKAVVVAFHKAGIIDVETQLLMFVFCRFGGFNHQADLEESGKFNCEYWDCGARGTCIFKQAICKGIMAENGPISRRELEIIKLVQKGLENKEIAVVLSISINTVANTLSNIFHKIGCNNRAEVINWAVKNNLV